jgi:hypothetical protein
VLQDGCPISANPGAAAPRDGGAGGPWVIYKDRRGSFHSCSFLQWSGSSLLRSRGERVTTVVDRESARAVCKQLTRDAKSHSGPFRDSKDWVEPGSRGGRRSRPRGRVVATTFRCGHPRSPENSYESGNSAICRQCHRRRALERYYQGAPRRRGQPSLPTLIYQQLRRLVARDGAWPAKRRRKPTTKRGKP